MPQGTNKKLTAEQVAQYDRDGYVCPVDAFSPERAQAWHEKLQAFERAEGQKMTRGHRVPWSVTIVKPSDAYRSHVASLPMKLTSKR